MTGSLADTGRAAFSALYVPNFRRFSMGQVVSLVGTWMQMTAQSWLVLTLTGSSTDVGLTLALQTLPILVLGPYAGVIADRVDKRLAMIVLQSLMGLQALALGLLVMTGAVRFWEVAVLAALLGVNNAFENPVRQSLVFEMVGAGNLRNAVTLNSVLANSARAIGPAVAGILIATVGDAVCFLVNAGSFVAVLESLVMLDRGALMPGPVAVRATGQLREGLRYVARTRELGVPLMMMAAVGCFGYEFPVTLPVMARSGLHVGASGFGFMTAAIGVGAVLGGLLVAWRGRTGLRPLVVATGGLGVTLGFAALAPSLGIELVALAFVGWSSLSFNSISNATLQLGAEPMMRGRVISLWFVAMQGPTPLGGPLIGWIMAEAGARAGLGAGAITCLLVAMLALRTLRRRIPSEPIASLGVVSESQGG